MPLSEVLREDKCARTVAARSLLCYWANWELGITSVEVARRLNLAQPTVSQSVDRGERIAAEKRVTLLSK
jgi:DNA-binding MarR family transcriptional regulator